ncbi:MAG TPA: hypothetical protein PKE56_14175, partial [Acidimicrobiales bacterium]|nr:hypothetical protein [Acidimicrobiales bacterium]
MGPLGEPAPQPPPETLVDPSGRPPELAVAVDLVDEELSEADHAIPDDIERPPSEPEAEPEPEPEPEAEPEPEPEPEAESEHEAEPEAEAESEPEPEPEAESEPEA